MITVYSAPWCGHCHRLKSQLDRAAIPYTEIDVDQTPGATDLIATLNDGDWLIPTVLFPDGSALVNPSIRQITDRLG
jgi:mycoredoxin